MINELKSVSKIRGHLQQLLLKRQQAHQAVQQEQEEHESFLY